MRSPWAWRNWLSVGSTSSRFAAPPILFPNFTGKGAPWVGWREGGKPRSHAHWDLAALFISIRNFACHLSFGQALPLLGGLWTATHDLILVYGMKMQLKARRIFTYE